ncbi:MAG: MGMT family protein [Gammaproteobacteria bacterium]|nr:MGMT family protein [Gammaproteobacteria bacterium]
MDDVFSPEERIWQVVASIPAGCVATYGQVAELAEVPRGARRVGHAMAQLPAGSKLPWHRVINAGGRISVTGPSARRQRKRLECEGIVFIRSRVSLKRFRWNP